MSPPRETSPSPKRQLFLPGVPLTEEDCVTKCKMIDVQSRMRELVTKRYEKNYPPMNDCCTGDGEECDHSASLFSGAIEFYRRAPVKLLRHARVKAPKVSSNSSSEEIKEAKEESSKARRLRCQACRKRLSVATVHVCQCGGTYCAPHRYCELHRCNYDYSDEWQAQLRRANPPANKAPKLPKI